MHKKINTVFFGFILLIVVVHFFFETPYPRVEPDSKLYQLLHLQRQIDWYNPLSENHLQGTHNSYNSDAYHHLFNYHDRQQHLSIGEQLNAGARFIELDVHWTLSFNQWPFARDLLLCHGSSKFNFLLFHWGCSPLDIPLERALAEISAWLKLPENNKELLIFYVEDHSEGQHEYLYNLLVKYELAQRMLPSGGCTKIPDEVSKHEIFQQGKQIVFWKDNGCSTYEPLSNLAFGDLGELQRHAEDRTFMGTYTKRFMQGTFPRIEARDVRSSFMVGANIINFDNFVVNDERLQELLWSWDLNQPIDSALSCVQQQASGRWLSAECKNDNATGIAAACFNRAEKRWILTQPLKNVSEAEKICGQLGAFVFSAPTNFIENNELNALVLAQITAPDQQKVWLNVQRIGNSITIGDKREQDKSRLAGVSDEF